MKIIKTISESKGGIKKEVVAKDENGKLRTLHIQKHPDGWKYCFSINRKTGQMDLKSIEV